MDKKKSNKKSYATLLSCFLLMFCYSCFKPVPEVKEFKELKELKTERPAGQFGSLEQRLITDGYDAGMITALYEKPEAAFEWKGVSLFFKHSEAKLDYNQFLNAQSIESARTYMENHNAELTSAEQAYGVKKEIITAIILVETRLGTFVGTKSVLNILSTMASLEDSSIRNLSWEKFAESSERSREEFEKWSERKSQWAYGELKSFLKYTEAEQIDPVSVLGSYAGAIGIAQFMPSNILKLAKDGDNDGRIDLFNHSDAIASIANYLKYHGWRPDLDESAAYKVLYQYNHSSYYVDTLLKIASQLSAG